MMVDTQLIIRLLEMKRHLQERSVTVVELCLIPRVFPAILMNGRLKREMRGKNLLSPYKKLSDQNSTTINSFKCILLNPYRYHISNHTS